MFHIINKTTMKSILAGNHLLGKGDLVCEIDLETGYETCTETNEKKKCKTKNKSGA